MNHYREHELPDIFYNGNPPIAFNGAGFPFETFWLVGIKYHSSIMTRRGTALTWLRL
ncbi:MAG TPA: hypothetical protein VFD62_12200 [Pyrinomonadaceae bacterium]|nr:hypothetical protein [Pyrinomonadaceae bacterium]